MLIADFGLSKEESSVTSDSLLKGTPAYIDPQCHLQEKYKRNKKSDIFSFGMILWEISSQNEPFAGNRDFQITIGISKGLRERKVDGTPESYFKLYTECWDQDPEKRPNIEEVVEVLENYDNYAYLTVYPSDANRTTNMQTHHSDLMISD
jgi:serine/threonine protein kinase